MSTQSFTDAKCKMKVNLPSHYFISYSQNTNEPKLQIIQIEEIDYI